MVLRAKVTNTGARTGTEVVQAYVRDLVATVSRPRRELKGFRRVELKAGESSEVEIAIPAKDLGFWHRGRFRVDPGRFAAWIGHDSNSGRELRFDLTTSSSSSADGKRMILL